MVNIDLYGKNVLVTGGAGFIGSHLTEKLVQMNSSVTVLDNLQAGKKINLENVKEKIKFIEGDIRDKVLIDKIVEDVEVIFHLGANASVPISVEDPRFDFETNSFGTFNLLQAVIDSDIKNFIFASSAAVYGTPAYVPIDEKHPLNPISPYGASKLSAERVGFAFGQTYGIPFSAIRIFNTYGPRQPRYVIYDLIKKLRSNPKKLEVLGDGNQVRDYCYIDDMIDAFILVAEKGSGVYNAAGGEPISIKELAEFIVSKIAPEAIITYGGKTWKGDIDTLVADISRLKHLGFKPKTSMRGGNELENLLYIL